jgi:Tfp pilus assembly protein PilV
VRDERGSIYVEAVIAAAVLAVGLLPVFGGWTMVSRAQDQTGRTNQALAIARGYTEKLHALSGAAWDALPPAPFPDSGYTVTETAVPRTGATGLKDVTVTVSWTDGKGQSHAVTLATSVARR